MRPDQLSGLKVSNPGMLSLLQDHQIDTLTTSQIQSVRFTDFRYLTVNRILDLTHSQLSSIPNSYWYYQIARDARARMAENGITWVNDIGIVFD